jgi:hypothetical protein
MTRVEILQEMDVLRATKIDPAYWRFSRQARALPPSMQEPEAYSRMAELRELLNKGITP